MGSTNERRRYNVTSSLIGWCHTQNYPLDLDKQAHSVEFFVCNYSYIPYQSNRNIGWTEPQLNQGTNELLYFIRLYGCNYLSILSRLDVLTSSPFY